MFLRLFARSNSGHRFAIASCVLAFVAALFFTTPGSMEAAQAVNGFVGRVDGTNAFIAVRVDDAGIMAYVCDSESYGEWFRGARDNSELVSAGGARLILGLGGDAARGVFTDPSGNSHVFTAATPSGQAAWLRGDSEADGIAYVAGWIILSDGDVRGFVEQDSRAPNGRERFNPGGNIMVIAVNTPTGPTPINPLTPGNFTNVVPGNGNVTPLLGR